MILMKPPTNQKTLLTSLLQVIFLVLMAITAFEYAKYMMFPRLTVFYSHMIGITFGVIIIGCTAYRVQKRQEKLLAEKIAETDRRLQSEASLREAEEKYRKLFIESMDGVCQTALDGTIVEANKSYCDIMGVSPAEIVGTSVIRFYAAPEDRIKFRHAIEQNKGVKNYEIIHRRADGVTIICSISSSYCYSKQGEVNGYLSIVRDITENKHAEAALEEERRRLQNALDEIMTLRGIVPICSYCKKIRDDQGYWNQVEQYVSEHTEAKFSHSICPACLEAEMKNLTSS